MISCAGEILFDLVSRGDGTFSRCAGGAPFNVARALAFTGADVGFYGCVGNDGNGDALRRIAENCGFSRSLIRTIKTRNTTLAFVTVSENGERDFFFHARGTADCAPCVDDAELVCKGADIVHLGSLPLRSAQGRAFARTVADITERNGAKLSFDVNYRDGLFSRKRAAYKAFGEIVECADIIKFGADELADFIRYSAKTPVFAPHENPSDAEYLQKAAESLSERKRGRTVFVTFGEIGALAAFDGKSTFLPAIPVKVTDTTGAGDAFLAGALATLDGGGNAEQALEKGIALGAEACKKRGAL